MLTQQLSLLNKAFSEVKYYHFHKSAGYRPTNPGSLSTKVYKSCANHISVTNAGIVWSAVVALYTASLYEPHHTLDRLCTTSSIHQQVSVNVFDVLTRT